MVVTAALRLGLRAALLLVHALAAGRPPGVRTGGAAGAAFAVALVTALAVALVLTLPVALVLALPVGGMALLSRRLRRGGSGDREGEGRDKELHHVSPEKMD